MPELWQVYFVSYLEFCDISCKIPPIVICSVFEEISVLNAGVFFAQRFPLGGGFGGKESRNCFLSCAVAVAAAK